jgi:two-component system, LytTR family, response regulator
MITAVLIDDEIQSCKLLEIKLKQMASDIQVVATIHSPADALVQLPIIKPDVVFLDIEMPIMDGFTLLRQLGEVPYEVIFVTAYNQHGINAIKMSALDYILKPVEDDELMISLAKLRQRVSLKKTENVVATEQINLLFESLQKKQNTTGRIALSTQDGVSFVRFQDIIKVESSSNYSTFFLKNKQKIIVSRTLKEYEESLDEFQFMRINRFCIINLDEVVKYRKGDGGTIELSDNSEIEVSPQRKPELLQRLGLA